MDTCIPSARSVDIWHSFISCCHPLTSPYDCIYHIAILLQVCAVAANDLGDLCFDNWIEHISTPFHMSVLYDWMARVKSPGAVHYQVRGYAVQHDHPTINYSTWELGDRVSVTHIRPHMDHGFFLSKCIIMDCFIV